MRERYNQITREILLAVAVAGAAVVAATSPYFAGNLARVFIKNRKYQKTRKNEQKIQRSIHQLRKNNFLIIKNQHDGNYIVQLTQKGKKKIEEINFEKLEIKKPDAWDKKWRIVISDIPESRKTARDAMRFKMKELKFYQLQKSVFVCPYPCEKEILFLCEFFDIFNFVNIITADKIHNDIKLRKHFGV